jgi:hypothetical protein
MQSREAGMWEGVTYVEPSRRPVIHEGLPAHAVVLNTGPAHVDLCVWDERTSDRDRQPAFRMTMPPGNSRSVSGPMIAVTISEKQPVPFSYGPFPFAAVAWRMVR